MSCPECFKGGIHNDVPPKGSMQTLHGVSCYVASPPSTSTTTQSQILFITDAFGLNLVNNKILADRYAAGTGCKVVVPELIPGGGADLKAIGLFDTVTTPVAWTNVWGQLNRIYSTVHVMSIFGPFLYRSRPAKAYPNILKFARAMKTTIPSGGKLGVCGFCWGGYSSTQLCTETAEVGKSTRLIDAQFCAHPSRVAVPDMFLDAITKFKIPYSMAIGDNDMVMGLDQVHSLEATLKQKIGDPEPNHYQVVVYPGCTHGFACRAKPDDKKEIDASNEAAKQAVDWFNKYLS